MPAFRSVRGTEDYLTARAANVRTGVISPMTPNVYEPTTPTTPRTPGEVLALRGDISDSPSQDGRRPSGAEMLNEYFGLGKKSKKTPFLKRRTADSVTHSESSQTQASISSGSRPTTPRAPDSPRTLASDDASLSCSRPSSILESPKLVASPSPRTNSIQEPTELGPSPTVKRSGTIIRVAAHWSQVKQALESAQTVASRASVDGAAECKAHTAAPPPVPSTPRRANMDEDTQSQLSGVSPLTIKRSAKVEVLLGSKNKELKQKKCGADSSSRPKEFSHLPSVRLVHPSLAAVPGVDRRAERVVELPELMRQGVETGAEKGFEKTDQARESTSSSMIVPIPKGFLTFLRFLVGPYRLSDMAGSGSIIDGLVALVRLLVMAYLIYLAWLVVGLVTDVISAICWPFRIITRFVHWSVLQT